MKKNLAEQDTHESSVLQTYEVFISTLSWLRNILMKVVDDADAIDTTLHFLGNLFLEAMSTPELVKIRGRIQDATSTLTMVFTHDCTRMELIKVLYDLLEYAKKAEKEECENLQRVAAMRKVFMKRANHAEEIYKTIGSDKDYRPR